MKYVIALVLVPMTTVFVLRSTVHAQPTKSVWDGFTPMSKPNAARRCTPSECASCHGPELMGGEMAPPLAGGDFLSGWDGLDRRRSVRAHPHLDAAERAGFSSSGQQNADILAFVLSANKFPTGTTELGTQGMMLKADQVRSEEARAH